MAKWLEKEVVSPIDGIPPIEEWQSARCSACGKYHTTPYMYYFNEYKFCPNCGQAMTDKGNLLEDGTLIVTVDDATKVGRVLVQDDQNRGGLYYADEPQTERQRLEGKRWTDALTIEEKKRLLEGFWIEDEPQERSGK